MNFVVIVGEKIIFIYWMGSFFMLFDCLFLWGGKICISNW
jgi:hypothetical protein